MTISLEGDSAALLFAEAVRATADHGRPVSPRGMPTRELHGAHLVLTKPRARLLHLPPARILNPAFAAAETVWHLLGSDAPWIFDYNNRLRRYADNGLLRGAYGPRMRRWGGHIDQLAEAIRTLREDPDSRRAVIQLYDPAQDAAGHRDVPCTLGFRFQLRQGQLHMATTMRSQDARTGLPYDLFFATVLHELMAGWVHADLGTYHHHVDSLHLYEDDMSAAGTLPHTESGRPVEEMPELATPWEDFDELLGRVRRDGEVPSHPGWSQLGAAMRSYRLWKSGELEQAEAMAAQMAAPLGTALVDWYAHLRARRASRAATAGGAR
ncbi:thymidylate synthase [Streptomyces justiciae]|uniref:thymidylate synthase n=1 Tax=Streptomyces justiciae TaxID=2780140 RepID=UPI001882592E|nr:thymidylate synthase [Streptomyces justiciae]MBE8477509.1 thymidylate synthase [Streptomyces justiciae]